MNKVVLKNISKSYYNQLGKLDVINNLSLEVKEGEIVAVVGPSGTGKSTILNLLAGLDIVDDGEIFIDGKVGYMFQHDLLFEWQSVLKNVLTGVEIKNKTTKEDKIKALKLLEKYELKDFSNSFPKELSGGMRQRVALIRTLIMSHRT